MRIGVRTEDGSLQSWAFEGCKFSGRWSEYVGVVSRERLWTLIDAIFLYSGGNDGVPSTSEGELLAGRSPSEPAVGVVAMGLEMEIEDFFKPLRT